MRSEATDALDRAGIPWRIAFTSRSLSGVWAAVSAGLGITLRTGAGVPASLVCLPPGVLPPLGDIGVVLHRADEKPAGAILRLADIIAERLNG